MYNVAQYIERCIRSLEEQNIPKNDYEIICINDGSPDNCSEIVTGLRNEYNNIVLINQENQGVSRARNNGINLAVGQYLLFIDPDDYIVPGCFERILNNISNMDAEISFLGYTFLNADGSVRNSIYYEKYTNKSYPGLDAYFMARGEQNSDPDRMVAVLFKRDFINRFNLRYLENVPYLEDGELIARILCLAEKCIFDGFSFYCRTIRQGSATNSKLFYSEQATLGFLLAAANLKLFKDEQKLNEYQRQFMNQPILKFVLLAVNSCLSLKMVKRLTTIRNNLKSIGLSKCNLNGCKSTYYEYGIYYNLSIWISAFMLMVRPRINKAFKFINTRLIYNETK